MKSIRTLLAAVSMVAMVGTTAAVAAPKAKKENNCEVAGKGQHVKDKAACDKKKGKWLTSETAPAAASQPAEGTTAPANAEAAPTK